MLMAPAGSDDDGGDGGDEGGHEGADGADDTNAMTHDHLATTAAPRGTMAIKTTMTTMAMATMLTATEEDADSDDWR